MAIRGATKNPVVVMTGGPVDIKSECVYSTCMYAFVLKANADAVIWCGYPGQSGGKVIAQVIYGEVNPSGRLPYTIVRRDTSNKCHD